MASATFTLRAVDQTRAAFASVQNSLQKIQNTTKGIGNTLKTFFGLQAFVSMGKQLNSILEDVEKNSKNLGLTAEEINKVTRATGAMDSMMRALKDGLVGGISAILGLKDSLNGVSEAESASIAEKIRLERDLPRIKELNEEVNKLVRELVNMGGTPADNFSRLADEIERVNNEASDPALSEELNTLLREEKIAKLSIEQRRIAIKVNEDFEKSRKKISDRLQNEAEKLMTVDDLYERLSNQLASLAAEEKNLLQGLPAIFDAEFVTAEDLERQMRLNDLYEEMGTIIEKLGGLETTHAKIARQAGDIISQSFEDAIFAGNKLSEVLRALAQDLLRMVFRESITAPMASGLGNLFKTLFRADGGSVASGSPYIVGERGPELFVPSASGNIIPNHRLGSGGGSGMGGGVTINYNISSGVSRGELVPILEAERKRLKAEIPDMVRRGGAYRAAFA